MSLPPFRLERYFAPREFTARYLLCASDCESRTVAELLALVPDAREALLSCSLGYTESAGSPALRAAIAATYTRVTPDDILVHAGAQEAILTLLTALVGAGDQAIVHVPCYQSLAEIPRSVGGEVTPWRADAERGWALDPDELARLITPRTKVVIVNTPHSPTGYLMPRDVFDRVVSLCERHGIVFLCDEVYRGLEHEPALRLPAACDVSELGVSLGVMSKAYGLAGLRIGWLATRHQALLARVAELKDYSTICSSAPSEVLATAALGVGERLMAEHAARVRANLARLDAFVARHATRLEMQRPGGGPTVFPRLLGVSSADAFCDALLAATGVLLLPGSMFEATYASHVRMGLGRASFAEGLEVFGEYLEKVAV